MFCYIYKVLRLIIRECLQERIFKIHFPIAGLPLLQMQLKIKIDISQTVRGEILEVKKRNALAC